MTFHNKHNSEREEKREKEREARGWKSVKRRSPSTVVC